MWLYLGLNIFSWILLSAQSPEFGSWGLRDKNLTIKIKICLPFNAQIWAAHKNLQSARFYEIAGLYVHVNRNITLLAVLNRIRYINNAVFRL